MKLNILTFRDFLNEALDINHYISELKRRVHQDELSEDSEKKQIINAYMKYIHDQPLILESLGFFLREYNKHPNAIIESIVYYIHLFIKNDLKEKKWNDLSFHQLTEIVNKSVFPKEEDSLKDISSSPNKYHVYQIPSYEVSRIFGMKYKPDWCITYHENNPNNNEDKPTQFYAYGKQSFFFFIAVNDVPYGISLDKIKDENSYTFDIDHITEIKNKNDDDIDIDDIPHYKEILNDISKTTPDFSSKYAFTSFKLKNYYEDGDWDNDVEKNEDGSYTIRYGNFDFSGANLSEIPAIFKNGNIHSRISFFFTDNPRIYRADFSRLPKTIHILSLRNCNLKNLDFLKPLAGYNIGFIILKENPELEFSNETIKILADIKTDDISFDKTDKLDMKDRYEFSNIDEVSNALKLIRTDQITNDVNGAPIKILSNYKTVYIKNAKSFTNFKIRSFKVDKADGINILLGDVKGICLENISEISDVDYGQQTIYGEHWGNGGYLWKKASEGELLPLKIINSPSLKKITNISAVFLWLENLDLDELIVNNVGWIYFKNSTCKKIVLKRGCENIYFDSKETQDKNVPNIDRKNVRYCLKTDGFEDIFNK